MKTFLRGHFARRAPEVRALRLRAFGRLAVVLLGLFALGVPAPAVDAKTSHSKHASKHSSKKHHRKSTAHRAPDTMFSMARAAKWSDARRLAKATKNPIAPVLAQWLYFSDTDVQPDFGDINAFLRDHPEWPARSAMFAKAELVMPDSMGPSEIAAWFGTREPKTGIGMVRLGEAKIALGDRAGGEALIRKAWAEEDFSASDEATVASHHAALLAGAPTAARIDRFLASRRTTDAKRTMAFADADTRALAEARLAMQRQPAKARSLAAGLPARLRSDPGLIMEEMRAIRTAFDFGPALDLADKAEAPKAARHWWPERNRLAREALDLGRYEDAYKLSSANGLNSGEDFADAEWLAGWIALRFLEKPEVALKHFRRLYAGVGYPVSKARAAYWAGRAAEASKALRDAAAYYAVAAAYPTTYYGQLAGIALGGGKDRIVLPSNPTPSTSQQEAFKTDEVVRVARFAAAAGEDGIARRFLLHLADRAKTPEEFALAGNLAKDLGYPHYALRIAKTAMQSDVILTNISYPITGTSHAASSNGVETALVLGLARQESEFNPAARSATGARGLMQLMPRTASQVAAKMGVSFSVSKLNNPAYNTKLGTAYLGKLIDSFNGSYVLAVASYNAGPTRAREWVARYGDPRDPKVDPIDWVERIPYSETRNYVQRVLENTQVYRGRLAGTPVALRVQEDLVRPTRPAQDHKALIAYLRPDAAATIFDHADVAVAAAEEPRRKKRGRHAARSEPPPPPEPVVASAAPQVEAPIMPTAPAPRAPADMSAAAEPVETAPAPPIIAAPLLPQPKPGSIKLADASLDPPQPRPSLRAPTLVPVINPFTSGQPESHGSDGTCHRFVLGANGKVNCAEK